jgi:uncharacterized Ntn-hydrolase superfamily protein
MRHGTYSIVARDAGTGELGSAVHSHWFSVGSVVSWAAPAAGAVATQSVAEPAYGPRALERMKEGDSAPDVLRGLLADDELAHVRQVACVDGQGRIGVHTGEGCIPFASHATGDGVSCQANMMRGEGVPEAMLAAYEHAEGDLAARLLAALQGAEAAGGDVRGRQSAAILVVPAEGDPWRTAVDLRVEDHSDPVTEMERLLRLQRAYDLAGQADELLAAEQPAEAGELYVRASGIAPESDELLFWAGLALAHAGDTEGGLAAVRKAAEANSDWLVLLDRLSAEFAPAGDAVRAALGRTAT